MHVGDGHLVACMHDTKNSTITKSGRATGRILLLPINSTVTYVVRIYKSMHVRTGTANSKERPSNLAVTFLSSPTSIVKRGKKHLRHSQSAHGFPGNT